MLTLTVLSQALALLASACGISQPDTDAAIPVTSPRLQGKNLDQHNWSVARENELPGTEAWKLRNPGPADAIEGYADKVSVLPGESFRLFVSTTAPGFQVEAFRMGWYQGKQGRTVWISGHTRGTRQSAVKVVPGIYEVYAPWRPSMTISTWGWPQGDYLLKLTSDEGHDRWVPLTVRSPRAAGRTVFMNSVTTWAAYNMWGTGTNVYGNAQGTITGYAKRSRKASFDRPYDKKGSTSTGTSCPRSRSPSGSVCRWPTRPTSTWTAIPGPSAARAP